MGLGDFFRRLRGDRRAMPDPDSPEFERIVQGSALPGSTEMGRRGWASAGSAGEAPETPAVVPGMPGAGSGQAGAVTPESLVAAGVPPESARATAAALAQLQQAFGGGAAGVGDLTVEHQGPQTLNMQGIEGLRDEMRATLREHGVDPDSGIAMDASSVPGLQEALLRVLARHGVDPSQYGG
ncbi:MAG TPA: hypothetical protein VFY99_11275 [Solirubrobacterales bacterium]